MPDNRLMVYEQMRRFFEFSGRTGTLAVALGAVADLLLVVFPNLPVGGDMLDTKPGYAYQEAMASMEEYGADGRTTYA